MEFGQYQKRAYVAIQDHESNKEEVMHWAIGLGEEAGEALSVIKHKYYGGNSKDSVADLIAELGDVLWHIAALCTASGIDMEDVAEYNLAKLSYRYPDQVFDDVRSGARHGLDNNFKRSEIAQAIVGRVKGKGEK